MNADHRHTGTLNSQWRMDTVFTKEQVTNFRSIDAARWVASKAIAQVEGVIALDYFRERWPRSASLATIERAYHQKSAVPIGTTESGSWAGALASGFSRDLLTALLESQAPFSILPRLGLPRAPFSVPITIDTTDTNSAVYWRAGAAASKILIQGAFNTVTLQPTVAAAIIVVTLELLRLSRSGTETYLRDILAKAITQFLDRALLDPSIAGVADASPASLTFGATEVTATGEPRADIQSLIAQYVSEGNELANAVFALSSANASAFALLDSDAFREMTIRGGTIAGIPAVAGAGAGNVIALINRSVAVVADDGDGEIVPSQHGSLEMVDESSSPAATQLVSLWQSNAVALRFDKLINWQANGGVVFLRRDYLVSGSPS
jgi:hypothetical protein